MNSHPGRSPAAEPGRPAELRLIRRDGAVETLPSKVPHMRIRAGENFVCIGPAGGGYGDPLARTRCGARRCLRWFALGGGSSPRIRRCAHLDGRSPRGRDGSPAVRDDQRADRADRIGRARHGSRHYQ